MPSWPGKSVEFVLRVLPHSTEGDPTPVRTVDPVIAVPVGAPPVPAPAAPRPALHRGPLLAAGALALCAAAVTADVLGGGGLTRLDHAIASWGAAGRWPQLRDVASAVVVAGQRGPVAAVVLAVVAAVAVRRRSWRPLLLPVAAIGALNAVVGALKLGIGRTAPYSGRDELFAGGTLFPSGHSANSVLTWGALSLVLLTSGVVRRRWPLIVAVAAVSVLVGAASMYLATHWLTDVLAGWLVGGALLAALAATTQHVLPVARPPQAADPRPECATVPRSVPAGRTAPPPGRTSGRAGAPRGVAAWARLHRPPGAEADTALPTRPEPIADLPTGQSHRPMTADRTTPAEFEDSR